jgi:hypothetical protein
MRGMAHFALDSQLNPQTLGDLFRRSRRLQVVNFLQLDSARALHEELAESAAWSMALNRGERILDLSPKAQEALTPDQWQKLNQGIAAGGRRGFQFCYDTIRLPKPSGDPAASPPPPPLLAAFAEFMSSPPVIAFMRTLTGAKDISFADAHASRYRANHFLTTHDDQAENMGRRAAYVLNLCPEWRPDWGGLLLFYDHQGHVVRGYTPGFNTLNIFAVPQAHSVSWVTPLAPRPRYAVTGWLRAAGASG